MANVKATHRLINSVWTAEFEIISEREALIKLIKYSRNDDEGYEKERELPQCTLIQREDRTVIGMYFRNKFDSFSWVNEQNSDRIYTIINPDHVFSYGA